MLTIHVYTELTQVLVCGSATDSKLTLLQLSRMSYPHSSSEEWNRLVLADEAANNKPLLCRA